MALDPQQQARLHAAKLRALARDQLGVAVDDARGLGDGAIGATRDGTEVVYLVEATPQRSLGRALAAGLDRDAAIVHLIAGDGAGIIARRARGFALDVRVWAVRDTELHPALPAPFEPQEPPGDDVLGLAADIAAAGADPVVERGVLIGEVRGLEIARVERRDGTAELRVGVGDFDREAFGLLHGDRPAMEAVREVVSLVAHHRRPGAPLHPLNRVASERWLRSLLIDDPARIGFRTLHGADPPVDRISIKAPTPAVAVGARTEAPDGAPDVIVVVSTGIDLEVVPYAVDARMALDPDADLVVVVPARDAHPVTRRLAAAAHGSVEVTTVPDDWRSWAPIR